MKYILSFCIINGLPPFHDLHFPRSIIHARFQRMRVERPNSSISSLKKLGKSNNRLVIGLREEIRIIRWKARRAFGHRAPRRRRLIL